MGTRKHLYDVPPGSMTVIVKLINPVNFGPAILGRFMTPPAPGLETLESIPSNCFLLEHPSGRKLVWDLGIRKDYNGYSPTVASYIPTTKYNIEVTKNVADILQDGGVSLDDIEAVIWSHWHWDHIGDPSSFPSTTSLIVGPGFKEAMLPGAPANPDSPIRESDYHGRELREVSFDALNGLRIGRFPAFDYFGDGSFYLIDTPGHAVGHLSGLVRTSSDPSTFVLLGGDIAHYAGIVRPSPLLPLPSAIEPHPLLAKGDGGSFCPGHAWEKLQGSRGRGVDDTLLVPTVGHDIAVAIETIKKLQELDCDEDIFVILAHDRNVRDTVDHFPQALNAWKQHDWGRKTRWAFLGDLEAYWREEAEAKVS